MTCKEISVADWNKLSFSTGNYFANGCLFDEKTDNLVAFSWYEDELHEVGKYYQVVNEPAEPHNNSGGLLQDS
jgi:hypothetical protein